MKTYLRSFSMRSTCVMSMRRQQYRLHPNRSIASLLIVAKKPVSSIRDRDRVRYTPGTALGSQNIPLFHTLIHELEIPLPKIARHLG